MCGRLRLDTDWSEIVRVFRLADAEPPAGYAPRWNLAPTQAVPYVSEGGGSAPRNAPPLRAARWGSWGFVPSWERSARPRQRPINARCETAATSGLFRQAFRTGRCVVPATGFYEWSTTPEGKRPWLFARRDRLPLALAGLVSTWRPEGGAEVDTVCVLTTTPNALAARVHDRMPVLLPDDAAVDAWLDPRTPPAVLAALCAAAPEGLLDLRPVSPAMNSARVDGPEACAIEE